MELPESERLLAGVGYLVVIALIARFGAVSAAGSFLPSAPGEASGIAVSATSRSAAIAPTLYRMASLP